MGRSLGGGTSWETCFSSSFIPSTPRCFLRTGESCFYTSIKIDVFAKVVGSAAVLIKIEMLQSIINGLFSVVTEAWDLFLLSMIMVDDSGSLILSYLFFPYDIWHIGMTFFLVFSLQKFAGSPNQ